MAIVLKSVLSKDAPAVKNALWIKPVDGGFAIYIRFNGAWQPLKIVDDGGTSKISDDVVQDLVGSAQDSPDDNTINGAKAFAQSIGNELVGSDTDTANEMSLYGLKAYIDAQIEALD